MTIVATPLPIRFVMARASDIKRSIPSNSASPATGTVPIVESVAANVMKPPPVTAAAPFEVSNNTPRITSCCFKLSGTFVACAMKTAAIVK